VLKVSTLVLKIAAAWILLSFLLLAFWVLFIELARRVGKKPHRNLLSWKKTGKWASN